MTDAPIPPPPADPPADPPPSDEETQQLAGHVLRQLARSVSRKDIRQFLVELTKQRATEILDVFSDTDRDHQTLTLPGVSILQIVIVRRWLTRIVAPELIRAYGQWLQDGTVPPAEPLPSPAQATTLSVAYDDTKSDTPPTAGDDPR